MKPLKQIRTAVIGVGNMGKNHARVYDEISTLCAVTDINGNIGKAVAQQFSVKQYSDFHEMLDQEKPDAVSVVVPTPYHKEVVLECLKRSIPTLVEKPIASNLAEAREMLNLSVKKNTYLLVGHIERFNPAVIRLKNIIDQKRVGKVVSLLAIRVGISPPRIPHANVLLDLSIHDVDICNYLLGEYPKKLNIAKQKLFKHTEVDSVSINLTYQTANASIITNWITPIKMRRLYVTGTEGFIELDYISQRIVFYNKILKLKSDGNLFEFISLLKFPKKEIFVSRKEPLKQELLYFLENRDNGARSTEVKSAIEALRIVLS